MRAPRGAGERGWGQPWLAAALVLLLCVRGPRRWKEAEPLPAAPASSAAPLLGTARAGRTESRSFRLLAGSLYQIGGVCDTRCADLDLRLYSGDSVVAEDVGPSATPLVRYAPLRSGVFTLRIYASRCEGEACGYKVGLHALRHLPVATDTNPRVAGVAPERTAKWPVPAALGSPPGTARLEAAARPAPEQPECTRGRSGGSAPGCARLDSL